jgi:hypothetical protein
MGGEVDGGAFFFFDREDFGPYPDLSPIYVALPINV